MLQPSLAAAEELAGDGIDITVLDLRWLSPLDEQALEEAVRESGGRVLVVHEAVRTGGFAAEVAMRINELCPGALAVPVRRLTTPDTRIPASPTLQAALLPNSTSIVRAMRELVAARAQVKPMVVS
jgi:2-oxoisovalerate dehydrogenase E1 component